MNYTSKQLENMKDDAIRRTNEMYSRYRNIQGNSQPRAKRNIPEENTVREKPQKPNSVISQPPPPPPEPITHKSNSRNYNKKNNNRYRVGRDRQKATVHIEPEIHIHPEPPKPLPNVHAPRKKIYRNKRVRNGNVKHVQEKKHLHNQEHNNQEHIPKGYEPPKNYCEYHREELHEPETKTYFKLPIIGELDSDKIMLLVLLYLLFKEGADKKLMMALGYVFMGHE